MYSINLPKINERIMIGGDICSFSILDINTTDSSNHNMFQREIYLTLKPLQIQLSYHAKKCISISIKIFKLTFRTEIDYGKSRRN